MVFLLFDRLKWLNQSRQVHGKGESSARNSSARFRSVAFVPGERLADFVWLE
jgi:hypothetical protein